MGINDFARVPRADFRPGDCLRCRRDNDLLDLGGGDLREYGRAYLCTVCFGELADNMEYISKASFDSTKKTLTRKLVAAEKKVTELEVQLSTVDNSSPAAYERFTSDVRDLLDRFPVRPDLPTERSGSDFAFPQRTVLGQSADRSSEPDAVDPARDGREVPSDGGAPVNSGRGAKSRSKRSADGDSAKYDNSKPEGDGAASSDLDDWVASLGEFDE